MYDSLTSAGAATIGQFTTGCGSGDRRRAPLALDYTRTTHPESACALTPGVVATGTVARFETLEKNWLSARVWDCSKTKGTLGITVHDCKRGLTVNVHIPEGRVARTAEGAHKSRVQCVHNPSGETPALVGQHLWYIVRLDAARIRHETRVRVAVLCERDENGGGWDAACCECKRRLEKGKVVDDAVFVPALYEPRRAAARVAAGGSRAEWDNRAVDDGGRGHEGIA